MGPFGERLRREREMRGITLEEIAAATKIGTRNLKALEEENFKILPGGIFNKGFVRAYARFLGINEEQAVADYLAASGEPEQSLAEIDAAQLLAQREEVEAQTRAAARKAKELRSLQSDGPSGFPWVALAGLILIALLAWGGRTGYVRYKAYKASQEQAQQEAERQLQAEAEAKVRADAVAAIAAAQAAAQQAAGTQLPGTAKVTPDKAAGQSQPPASGLTSTTAQPKPDTKPQPTATQQKTSTEPMVVAAGNFVLSVHAKQRVWLSVMADGKEVLRGELPPSSKRDFQAHDRVTIKTGYAPGTEVAFNGKSLTLPPLSGDSTVQTFTVSSDGKLQLVTQ